MVAGGTGGHIYPALSLAAALRKRGHEVRFIGADDRLESTLIPSYGYPFTGLTIKSPSGNLFRKFASLYSMIKAYRKALKLLEGQADAVIGFGNYITVPILKAAAKLRIKVIIHEQNSLAGKANLALAKVADLIILSYQESLAQFHSAKAVVLGNPRMAEAAAVPYDPKVLTDLGLIAKKKTVVIFMGSLGSASVAQVIAEYLKDFKEDYQVVYATGKEYYQKYSSLASPNAVIKERIDALKVMRQADLAIVRAGATTLAEICGLGIASILIPSPYVPANHQYLNAMTLCRADAAVLLEEKDLNVTSLKEEINRLLKDDQRRQQLAAHALALAKKNVLNDIIDRIFALWK